MKFSKLADVRALTALAFLKRERGHHRLLYTLDLIEAAA